MRVGFGYDVHHLILGRKLILGGEIISYEKGLDGHSDADVLIHSIIDALLGAAGEGDIGQHFPDNDERYKDISSLKLLRKTYEILKEKKFAINNIDISVVLEEPLLTPFIIKMKNNIAKVLKISSRRINIKATTNEKMGFIGRKEGIASYCVVSLTYAPRNMK
ncbi:MAG: 2-C-methyl-D-erythritol 2,4-cyclodiphosphate synthase [Candidatus Infernicultor aquiphilus]|uniref:2-C-methyl-D-erythritol 2,4-cyclodiphosphate synthase n=1 Tax=Candidatus Infernicultor aquiphilus TaxID=1805029 RepID=A0A1J5GNT3_9BACT|nr:2-C-methyl-D-erythritol 2,4-cyclodiphosphate synthase [bacterium]OIP69518.1 MAG: 2-C-methyl-D-erythritol 2,4-cyclodiphosphate synthase [Candidatus Atribacteria bacterium CG2_30_33_13]PIU25507.1 MAG: 2-C-methyl-D-erythritol 2,4-cyclodiphosphate synthase [Candidatus Atribacteria bacterium CG08_land_8_20_14_0_20_33_29]PIW12429.1 MAG: 2-C-methyl-D-erythritol 2,4-cyclodiphosphate synthase [Candidatus Atribacteria bacterium CG17_big_fil_post_rev_8_21_14_2_50_34_11]PIX34691.1 MAG: 2-C-methyl-D-eryt